MLSMALWRRCVSVRLLCLRVGALSRCGATRLVHEHEHEQQQQQQVGKDTKDVGGGVLRDAAVCAAGVTPRSADDTPPAHATTTAASHPAAAPATSVTSALPYTPVDCAGTPYAPVIAAQLRAVARERGYTSPVWATRLRYAALGVSVAAADDDAGVCVQLTGHTVRLYNVAATNHAALVSNVAAEARVSGAGVTELAMPCDVCGRLLSRMVATHLSTHPCFALRQRADNVWISLLDIYLLDLHIRPEERGGGVVLPSYGHLRCKKDDGVDGMVRARAIDADRDELVRRYAADLPHANLREQSVYYHISQLCEAAALREELRELGGTGDADAAFTPYSLYGVRYSVANAFLLRRFCRSNALPTRGLATFVTPRQLQAMGGALLRVPAASATTTEAVGSAADAEGDGGGDAAGLPSPALLYVNGDVVSIYHAAQTNIATALMRRMQYALSARSRSYVRERTGATPQATDAK